MRKSSRLGWHTCQAQLVTKVQYRQPSKLAMIHQRFMVTTHYAWQLEQKHILVLHGFNIATECCAKQAVTSFEEGVCYAFPARLTVVLYDLKKADVPSSLLTLSIQSVMPLYGLLATCNRCFTTSDGVMTPSFTMVAIEPATAVAMGWCPASLPPSASFASSYVAKYRAWAGLQAAQSTSELTPINHSSL